MALNVAAAICDDHSKNVAFLLPEGVTGRRTGAGRRGEVAQLR
jgi:serine/threonine protein kinase HipA of HipAB toxin-antitoxin module